MDEQDERIMKEHNGREKLEEAEQRARSDEIKKKSSKTENVVVQTSEVKENTVSSYRISKYLYKVTITIRCSLFRNIL